MPGLRIFPDAPFELPLRQSYWAFLLACGLIGPADAASIRTDGSTGPATTLSGPNYLIPQSLGTVSGQNLFHSFQRFGIATGESALFTTSVTGNVISRVSGGAPSLINGPLAMLAGGGATPAFWFINPAGVVFGAGASLNVPGAFHVSTADYVSFGDGRRFYADLAKSSALSSAPPESFGFLGSSRQTLEISDGALLYNGDQAISLVAGDIVVDNARVYTNHGDIKVVAVGKAVREIPLSGDVDNPAGTLSIGNGGLLATATYSAQKAGNIKVRAGTLTIDGSDGQGYDPEVWTGIVSETYADGQAGKVDIGIAGSAYLVAGGAVASNTYGAGNAGPVAFTARNLYINRGHWDWPDDATAFKLTGIFSDARPDSSGNGGTVDLRVSERSTILNGGFVASDTYASGNAGQVRMTTGSLWADGYGNTEGTGISSLAKDSSTGNAGDLDVRVAGQATILAGANVISDTYSSGKAGAIHFSAGSLRIDSQDTATWTGISSDSAGDGDGGNVTVTIDRALTILNGGAISSNTYAAGNAGNVTVSAGSLSIDRQDNSNWTGIFSSTRYDATGNAGDIAINVAGSTRLLNGGAISSDTYTAGNAGNIALHSGSLYINGMGAFDWGQGGTGVSSNAREDSSGHAGRLAIAVDGLLSILNGGTISSDTAASGNAGSIDIAAGSLSIDSLGTYNSASISSTARSWSSGNAGNVNIAIDGSAKLRGYAYIGSDAEIFTTGRAGSVTFSSGSLSINGQGNPAGISSDTAGDGNAGNISVTVAGKTTLVDGGTISSNTYSDGDAGSVEVRSGSLLIDRRDAYPATGILTNASEGSFGNAGDITVRVDGQLSLINGGMISSDIGSNGSFGNAGTIAVRAGQLLIDGQTANYDTGISSRALDGTSGNAGNIDVSVADSARLVRSGIISSDTYGDGNAGAVSVRTGNLTIDQADGGWTGISSDTLGKGNAGDVTVIASGQITLVNGGTISSDNYDWGDHAGTVSVKAGSLLIDGSGSTISSQAHEDSKGDAGQVRVQVAGLASLVNGGTINSDTAAVGDAGSVSLTAGQLLIDRGTSEHWTGISSDTLGWGDAGNVNVVVGGEASLRNGALISSSTYFDGRAGNVSVRAGNLVLDGSSIGAFATEDSSGQTGNLHISASRSIRLANGATISIENDATVADPELLIPTTLRIAAPDISIIDSSIAADSTGNIAASNIDIHFGSRLFIDPSVVSTSAAEGNGGSISIAGQGVIWLDHSQITTSVSSLSNGNGGDINLSAGFLVMNSGFIQANTAAPAAFGGNINLNIQSLVPSNNWLLVGGSAPYSFNPLLSGPNVIQAAAPDGVAGTIAIASPTLDVSGSLAGIKAQVLDNSGLGRNPCDLSAGSSLGQVGRGGLAASPFDVLRVGPPLAQPVTGLPTAIPVAPATAIVSCRAG